MLCTRGDREPEVGREESLYCLLDLNPCIEEPLNVFNNHKYLTQGQICYNLNMFINLCVYNCVYMCMHRDLINDGTVNK